MFVRLAPIVISCLQSKCDVFIAREETILCLTIIPGPDLAFPNGALDWALEKNLCKRNVCRATKKDLPERQGSKARALPDDEVQRLIAAAAGTPWQAFFMVAICTGARRGELCGLRWADVDFERSTLTIAQSVVRTNAGLEFKGTKTGRARTVPLNGLAVAALRAHRVRQNAERLQKGELDDNSGLVFANEIGRPWNPDSITNAFVRIAEAENLSTTRPHDLRHSAATWLMQSKVDVRTVSAILGHSTPSTTLDIYAHVMPGAEVSAVETIAQRLGSVESGGS